jgi:hypothetical protein
MKQVVPSVDRDEEFQTAVPAYDLAVKAGTWGTEVEPEVVGWARLVRRPLELGMFVAQVVGHSMEPGIPDGAWGLFRSFPLMFTPRLHRSTGGASSSGWRRRTTPRPGPTRSSAGR